MPWPKVPDARPLQERIAAAERGKFSTDPKVCRHPAVTGGAKCPRCGGFIPLQRA